MGQFKRVFRRVACVGLAAFGGLTLFGVQAALAGELTGTPTSTQTPTQTPTQAPTQSPTQTPTHTPTEAPTPASTATPGPTATASPTSTATPSPVQIPSVGFASSSVAAFESTSDAPFTLSVMLSSATEGAVSVDYATTSTGSAQPGLDYASASGSLTIPPHALAKDIKLTILGDSDLENDETFNVILRNPVGATLGRSSAEVTIYDSSIASILKYLLGLTNDATGLDVNSDGKVNVADLVVRVALLPPDAPTLASPSDGTPGVSATASLAWTASSRAESYELYLWQATEPQPAVPTADGPSVLHLGPFRAARRRADLSLAGRGGQCKRENEKPRRDLHHTGRGRRENPGALR